ncbi:MAG TPA: GH116 family glycosyl hydrolase [Vicinamibacteria bacterium]|nr:GH116 family glycosyl hydrolase [Vicinamibacteria bacterium]
MRLARVAGPVVLATIVALSLASGLRAADAPALPGVKRFTLAASPIGLVGDVRPQQYLGVVGPRSAWLGSETGEAELWVHPLKLASGFRLDFRIPDYAEPVRGRDVARSVEVRPEATTISYSHAAFTVRQHILAPLDEPGLLVLLEIDASRPLEVVASFRSVLQYAWPGGLGGQYAFWSDEDKAFVLSESLRRRNAFIGSPWAASATSHPAHALPDAPSSFTIPIDPARTARELVPIAIAASTAPRADVALAYRRLVTRAREIYDARVAHARRLREESLRIDSPDDRLDLAFEWAKVNLDEQTVCNPDLGCGLVAGWGPSGEGARPGFGWFFGGDAAINSLAMAATGQWSPAWDGLRFLARYQRADGKLPHEVSQSAGVVPWFDQYPYAYYHADTTPFFLLALHRQWRASGDARALAELWPAARKAWAWCLPHDTDGDGIIENTTGGLGAIEVGAIGDEIHQDVYLAAVFARAAGAVAEMAAARGEGELAAQAGEIAARARTSIESRYWIEAAGHHAFGVLRTGRTNDTLTVWPATAAAFGLLEPAHARLTLSALGSHALTADWGARMLSTASPLYDPAHYNMGAVWPFVTGFLALGHYQYERPWAGYPLVDALARLGFDWARGRHPELLSGDRYRPLDTAVPQQFFATSMLVSPIAYGLLGFEPDAPSARARLAPQLPPEWETLRVTGLAVGKSRLDARFERRASALRIQLVPKGPPLLLELRPMPPRGARALTARLDGRQVPARPFVSVTLDGLPRVVDLRWEGGLELEAPQAALTPGQPDQGIRVLDFAALDGGFRLAVEGLSGSTATLRLHGERPAGADSGTLRAGAGVTELEVTFPTSGARFSRTEVRLRRP